MLKVPGHNKCSRMQEQTALLDVPQCIKLAMISVYKLDKVVCLKHIAAEKGVSLSYHSRSEEARRASARKKQKRRARSQCPYDISAQFPLITPGIFPIYTKICNAEKESFTIQIAKVNKQTGFDNCGAHGVNSSILYKSSLWI